MSRCHPARARHPAGSGGFTLIELLVVITIIAILASMLLPAVRLVRNQAQVQLCSANLRQIHLGCSSYASDFSGFYPPSYSNPNAFVWIGTWPAGSPHGLGFLTPDYLDTTAVLVCPGFPLINAYGAFANRAACGAAVAGYRYNGNPMAWGSNYTVPDVSYGISNGWPIGPTMTKQAYGQPSMPSTRVILAYDIISEHTDSRFIYHPHPVDQIQRPAGPVPLVGGGNAVFSDGHIEWLPVADWGIQGGSMGAPGDYYCPISGY